MLLEDLLIEYIMTEQKHLELTKEFRDALIDKHGKSVEGHALTLLNGHLEVRTSLIDRILKELRGEVH